MPSLDWIGRKAVENHHKEVSFHLLQCNGNFSFWDLDSGNLLVQGDHLLALKALLPNYVGQLKCSYIDTPYNTENENWIYNDNVNSPQMRECVEKLVGLRVASKNPGGSHISDQQSPSLFKTSISDLLEE